MRIPATDESPGKIKYLQFYSQYLELPSHIDNSPGFISVKCPFADKHDHADKSPSAGVDLTSGVFKCMKCDESWGPARFLAKIRGIGFVEASTILDEYRRENKLVDKIDTFVKTRSYNPKWEELYAESRRYFLGDIPMVTDYCESRGIELGILRQLGVGWLPAEKTHWKRDSLVFAYTMDGKVVGLRYRDAEGNKGGEKGCHFTLWGLDQLNEEGHIAIVVEGETDNCRTFQELRKAGESWTVLSSPTGTWRHEWTREFEDYYRVVILHQGDATGFTMAQKAQEALGEKCAALTLPWKRKQVGKDVCDWFNYNSGEELAIRIKAIVGDGSRRFMVGQEFKVIANQPRHFLINGLLARRQVAIMAGPPKNMKTWLLLNIFRCILAPGEEFAGIPGLICPENDLKLMIVEEEGDAEELYERMALVFHGLDWEDRVIVGHHLGCKLDEEAWIERLEKEIARHNIACIGLDPLQRMHGGDENSATEMATPWTNIHRLTTRFPTLTPVLLHHFNKAGDINMGWNALRGSGRTAAEADLGIFVQKRPKSEGPGIRMKLDGRTLKNLETADGKDIFQLAFDERTGLLRQDTVRTATNKKQAMLEELMIRGSWSIADVRTEYGITEAILTAWIDTINVEAGNVIIIKSAYSPGNPSAIHYKGK